MADTLSNARFDQLPAGGFIEPDDLLAFRSAVRGVTYSIKAKDLIPTTNNNFQWVSTNEYDEDEVVTYGGLWWQSQQDVNEGHVPGTEGDDWWVAVPKAVGFGWWSAGVYTEDKPMVLSSHSGQTRWYRLADGTRPFISVDIETEEQEGKWEAITGQNHGDSVAVDALITLNCKWFRDIAFAVIGTISDDVVIAITNDPYLTRMSILVTTDTPGKKIKFPANFRASNAQWDPAQQEWEVPEGGTGATTFDIVNYGGIYYITNVITNYLP